MANEYKDPNTDIMKALSKAVDAATGETGTQYKYKNPNTDVIQKLEELIEAIATSGGGGSSGHNYSTTEQVVGTWVDGSTVYERTWMFTSSVNCSSNSWSNTPVSASGISSIIDGKVYDVDNSGNLIALWGNVGISCDDTYINILNTRNTAIGIKCMTLQYLKSST